MLDPNALGTAFDIHWQLVHSVTFIEHFSGPQGRRRCLAAGVLDIWHGTDPPDHGTAQHGTSLTKEGCPCGNLGNYGSRKIPKMKFLDIKIHHAQNVGKVQISREKQLPAKFGAISGNFQWAGIM